MPKIRTITKARPRGRYYFHCPGCKDYHFIPKGIWTFNDDVDKPTFAPSIKVTGTIPLTDEEYDRVMKGETVTPVPFVCHSFVRDGNIQFLNDCTHALKGQTVELQEVKELES